ncbi:MAG: EamA family transporter [Erysipelotrichaceae bacterium]|nr:EamA family transporter [Erysipelotrichaceae bacterium]
MKKNKGPLYIVIAALLWSTGGFLAKLIPWNAFSIGIIRGSIAAFVQLLYRRKFFKITKPILLTALCYFGVTTLFMLANKMTSAGSAIVLQHTSPLYVALFSYLFLKKKPSKHQLFCGVAIFTGVLLSMLGSMSSASGNNPVLGNLLALLSGVFYAGVFFTSRLPGSDALASTILGNSFYLVCSPFLLMDNAFMHPAAGSSQMVIWAAALFLGFFQLGVAYIFFSEGIKTTDSLQASFIATLEPVLNPILAFFILGERMDMLSICGSVLVIGSIILNNYFSEEAS